MQKSSNCKSIIAINAVLFLGACTAANVSFTGNSATFGGDNILRNDVFKTISDYERIVHQCREISAVTSRIVKGERVNGRMNFNEIWQVQACGQTRIYPVFLREDENGETDYTVRLGANN